MHSFKCNSNKQTAGTEKVDLKIKAHANQVHHCQYSFDGTSFFTCGGQAVKVLHVSSKYFATS